MIYNAGIFIAMNPVTKGYGGRQKLPGNLKQVFRPVAMSVPGNELIAEVNHGSTHCAVVLAVDDALNSVLDDNRLLTMPSGERNQFGTNVNLIFETDNLRFASPSNHQSKNLPLGGGCRCKANDRLVDCAAAS